MRESAKRVEVRVVHADVTCVHGDVLALKYPQGLRGLGRELYDRLTAESGGAQPLPDRIGGHVLLSAPPDIAPERLLYVGVEPLTAFGDDEIRRFSHNVLSALHVAAPGTKHVLMTLHGVEHGLEPEQSFNAELAGVLDALGERRYPAGLRRISIVENKQSTWSRIRSLHERVLPDELPTRGDEDLASEEESDNGALVTQNTKQAVQSQPQGGLSQGDAPEEPPGDPEAALLEPPPPFECEGPFLFVAYKREDMQRVAPHLHALVGLGHNIWYDRGIPGGAEWDALIEDKVGACRAFVVFLSQASVDSKWCRREIRYADSKDKRIIAICLEEVRLHGGLDLVLVRRQMIDARARGFDRDLKRALKFALPE